VKRHSVADFRSGAPADDTARNGVPASRWLRVIPPIVMVCVLSYMDRVNIGFAIPGGMGADLALGASMAGLAGGIFFIGYLFLQVPGGTIAVHGSGRKFIAWSLLSWAALSVLTGLVQTATQLLLLRFLLGVAEGGMLPVAITMVSNWFPDKERGRANALVISFVPIAGMITAPLSGFIIAGLDWRYLFFIEGLLTFAFLFVWLWLAGDRPAQARWITQAERDFIESALRAEQQRSNDAEKQPATFRAVLADRTTWHLIAINFFYQAGVYGYTLWLPTILKTLTQGGMAQVGMLAFVPYLGTLIGMIVVSALSDRSGRRKPFVVAPLAGFAACLFLSVAVHTHIWLAYAFLVGCGVFLQAAAGVFWTIPPRILRAEACGGARGLINALGNLGGFCGPYAVGVLVQSKGQGTAVHALAASVAVAAMLAAVLPRKCDQ
jgi:sugar phosphate permease